MLHIQIIRDDRYLLHKTGVNHPESPERLGAVYRMLDWDYPGGFLEKPAKPITLEDLERVHTPSYVRIMLATARQRLTHLAPDTIACRDSCLAAWLAAGGCVQGVDSLLAGECGACLVLCRPPGHHALPDRAGGFCIFNNLGLAARHALRRGVKRILLVDWDIHHGNALQNLFYADDAVVYVSTHLANSYPFTGKLTDTGVGPGAGHTINLPLPSKWGDNDAMALYRNLLGELVERYSPEMIMVACGFDAHYQDPIGATMQTEASYAGLTHLVATLGPRVNGVPLLMALEGGYDPTVLCSCVRTVIDSLQDEHRGWSVWSAQSEAADELLARARRVHMGYGLWVD